MLLLVTTLALSANVLLALYELLQSRVVLLFEASAGRAVKSLLIIVSPDSYIYPCA